MYLEDYKLEIENFPRIPCPSCESGLLVLKKDSILKEYPSSIKQLPEYSDHNVMTYNKEGNLVKMASLDMIQGTDLEVFIATLFIECDREQCRESIAACGEIKTISTIENDPNYGPYDNVVLYFFPKMFHPTIELFDIPKDTPKQVKSEIRKSFSLFWANPSACGNSLRKSIERILDQIEGASRQTLHKRIENLDHSNQALKDFLMAAKWIGNDGSHDEIDLEHIDVIIGFKFIEKCLEELFGEKTEPDLNEIARKINQFKKSISKI